MRNGADYKVPDGGHTAANVFKEMLLQITRDYSGLPDIRSLKIDEILFFYEGLRQELKETTKPRK